MVKRKSIALYFVGLLILALSCSRKNIHDLMELIPLRKALIKEYRTDEVNLSIWNGNTLAVSFINSPFNDLSKAEKEVKAKEIARFVNGQYTSMETISTISVSFVVHKNYVIFNYNNSLSTFFFPTAGLNAIDTTFKKQPATSP